MRSGGIARRWCGAILVLFAAVGAIASGQSIVAAPPGRSLDALHRRYAPLRQQGNYLGVVRILREEWAGHWVRESPESQSLTRRWGLQLLAEELQAIGCYREAQQRLLDRDVPPPSRSFTPEEREALRKLPLAPAEKVVMEAAKRRRLLIINETHYQPEHRAFGARLLPQLRRLGFRYLALETPFQASLKAAMDSGRVRRDTDPYAGEPQRAALLRAALQAGFRLVAFDLPGDTLVATGMDAQQLRETEMARNIQEQILDLDPAAKVVIWVGMGHACKVSLARGAGQPPLSPMARELWQRTGIEPFTCYQVSDPGGPSPEGSVHQWLAAAQRLSSQPLAARYPLSSHARALPERRQRSPVYAHMAAGGIDALIVHPASPVERGADRPRWLQPRNAADIRGRVLSDQKPGAGYLVQALLDAEGDEGAPVDQVVTESEGRFVLKVPAGEYRLRVWGPAEGESTEQVVISTRRRCRAGDRIRQDFTPP